MKTSFELTASLLISAALLFTACAGGSGGDSGGDANVPVTGIMLNKTELSLVAGSSEQLIATVLPTEATNKNVTWSIDNSTNISLQQDGTVSNYTSVVDTAVVTVTTEDGAFTASCNVTVETRPGVYKYVAAGNAGLKIIDVRWPSDPHLESTCNTTGHANGVFVKGNYAYVAEFGYGLEIIDISDPDAPVRIGGCATNDRSYAHAVWVEGNYAYVADDYMDLAIIDVTDPANPALLGSFYTNGIAVDVTVSGGYVYVVNNNGSLAIKSLSNPASPGYPVWYSVNDANSVFVSGNYAYLAATFEGLIILDISNPLSPVLAGSYNTAGNAMDVYVSGNYAYVADKANGLAIIDISDPADPGLTGTYDTGGSAYGVTVTEDYAYVADFNGGLVVVDVSSHHSPSLEGIYNLTYNPKGIDKTTLSYVYVADDTFGLKVISTVNNKKPSVLAYLDTDGHATDVEYNGIDAFVADGVQGLKRIGVGDPLFLFLIDDISLNLGYAQSVSIDGSYAYVSNGDQGLFKIDLSDTNHVKNYSTFFAKDQAVVGDQVFVATNDKGLVVVHTAAEGSSNETTELTEVGYGAGIAVYGNLAYMTRGADTVVINISDPEAPFVAGDPFTTGGGRIIADLDYLYIAGLSDGLSILNRWTGELIGFCDNTGPIYGLDIDGNKAYVCGGDTGLHIIDISNKSNPTIEFSEGYFMAVH
ncbi:MAG: Ig-like domain-containing protein [Spirochaetota bacterium]